MLTCNNIVAHRKGVKELIGKRKSIFIEISVFVWRVVLACCSNCPISYNCDQQLHDLDNFRRFAALLSCTITYCGSPKVFSHISYIKCE